MAQQQAENSSRRALLMPVYVPTALLSFGQGILLPTLPLFALDFDVSFGVAGLVVAAASIGTLIADVPAGIVLSRVGLKRTMLIGVALVALATLALGIAHSIPE